MIQIVSVITLENTNNEEQAVNELRRVVADLNFGKDALVVLHSDSGAETIGQVATKSLAAMAEMYNRALVIRCDDNFKPYIMDYPEGAGRPYPVNINVSEIAGLYEEATNG